jgi:hypothetical protein
MTLPSRLLKKAICGVGPQHVEADVGGQPGEPELLVPDLCVGHVAPSVAGEYHLHADVHRVLLGGRMAGRHDFTIAARAQSVGCCENARVNPLLLDFFGTGAEENPR